MASRDKILARIGESKAQLEGWFARGGLPAELQDTAARRLGVLALLTGATFLSFSLIYASTTLDARPDLKPIGIGCSICTLVLSLAIFAITRWRRDDPRLLLNLGVVYQIAMAAVIGVADNFPSSDVTIHVRGWSGVAVWIFIFAVFVPSTPRRTLVVSSVVALMDPLSLLLCAALGSPFPSLALVPQMLGPTVVAVVTAVIASRINYSLGRKLHEAREMGSYRLLELLGRGGMGEVWRAEHKMLARPAAIKLIRADALKSDSATSDQEAVRRFEREAQATALLQSEHTIELYDFGVAADGSFYYVMELLDGLDLEELVKRYGPMPVERAVFCLGQVCESLAEAHEGGLVHRDIKPSNIFVCRRGLKHDYIKVLDFGLVKPLKVPAGPASLTADGSVSGTPAFMVPEIIQGSKDVDGRADLYAVGCVAYWLVSGRLVFEGENAMKMIVSHVRDEPEPLSARAEVPATFDQLVRSCLEKDPAKRPRSARELGERLAALEVENTWTQERARAWWEERRSPADPDRNEQTVDPLETTLPPC
jgi:serine/threonine-protein kinase